MKTKNKLLMMAFTLVAFLSFGVMNVNAAETIGDVTLDGAGIKPVVGNAPQTLTVPADAPYEIVANESGWFDDDILSHVAGFTVDTPYTYVLELRPKEGNMFNADALLSITGLNWNVYKTSVDEDGFLTFWGRYTVASTPGVNYTIDGSLIRPIVGKTSTSLALMLPEDVPYKVQFEAWFLDTETPATPYTGNFADGVGYGYAVAVCPKEGSGFTFGANDTLTISGIPWKNFGSMVLSEEMFEGCASVEARYKASMITIDEVNISGIIEPVEGFNPIHSNAGLKAEPKNSMLIAGEDNGFFASKTDTTLMNDAVPFTQGQTVYFKMNLVAEIGYEFVENPVFKYKGSAISSENISFDSTKEMYTIYIPFTVQPLVYDYLSGSNLSTGNLDELTFRIDADYSLFSTGGKVYVDGNLLTNDKYTSSTGSTIITLDETYAGTLAVGEHTLRVEFNNGGESETTFTILDNQQNNNDTITDNENPQTGDTINDTDNPQTGDTINDTDNPQTGDTINDTDNLQTGDTINDIENPQTGDNIAMSIALGLISLVGLFGVVFYTKKTFN